MPCTTTASFKAKPCAPAVVIVAAPERSTRLVTDSEAGVRTWATVCAWMSILPELPLVRVTVMGTVPTFSLTV